ncbi:MAG: hypothetical protein IKU32_02045 [Clostridia bacterium]|nr:hypothetical protein [Clostridia bacterium]
MNKKYTLKQTKPPVVEKVQEKAAPAKSRKGVIICLSLLCLLLLGGGIYMYQAMNIEIESLEKSLEYNRTRCIELNEQLKKTETELTETKSDSANYKRLKDYYAPYEKMFDAVFATVGSSEIKEVSALIKECVSDSVYNEQMAKWESWQKESVVGSLVKPGTDLGLYYEWNSDGEIVPTDRVWDKVLDNREKGINPSK